MRPMTVAAAGAAAAVAVAAAAEIVLLSEEDRRATPAILSRRDAPISGGAKAARFASGQCRRKRATHSPACARCCPPRAHGTLDDLQDICDEARQLSRQERLHHWLHGWLLLHIPLSLALIVLGAIHAIMALRFSS